MELVGRVFRNKLFQQYCIIILHVGEDEVVQYVSLANPEIIHITNILDIKYRYELES